MTLTFRADVIPPWAEESVVAASNLLGQDVDTLVVEWREPAEQRVEYTSESPHIDTLAVSLVLDNLRCGVTHRSTRRHGLFIPYNFTQTEICNFDLANTSTTNARDEFSFVLLVLVVGSVDWVFRRDDLYPIEQQILGLDISVNNPALFVEIPNTLCDLENDVPRQVLAKVSQLDDLVEQFSSSHNFVHS